MYEDQCYMKINVVWRSKLYEAVWQNNMLDSADSWNSLLNQHSASDAVMHHGKSLINQSLLCNLLRHQFIKADVRPVELLFVGNDYPATTDGQTKYQFSPSPLSMTDTQNRTNLFGQQIKHALSSSNTTLKQLN